MNEEHVYTVSELNRLAREVLETGFSGVWLRGEISEMTRAASGHLYFTLKDADSEIGGVRFRSLSSALAPVQIDQGMAVLALGRLTVYEPRGRYQFIASLLQPLGAGELQASIERLKARLNSEGLFDLGHKKPLPRFPRRIGVITSPSGAAFRDVRSVLSRRWPLAELYLFPTSVQGVDAPAELIAALDRATRFSERTEELDVIIFGRGGGSAEDLAAFSDEGVVRAIFACPIPVISAVGHEIDISLSDLVADVRAPTPASAAELVAPECTDLAEGVSLRVEQMTRAVTSKLLNRSERFRRDLRSYLFRIPGRKIETIEQRLDGLMDVLGRRMSEALATRTRRLTRASDLLRLSDPDLPLRRGYSLTFLKGSSEPLRDLSRVEPGSEIETRLEAGRMLSRVEEVIDE